MIYSTIHFTFHLMSHNACKHKNTGTHTLLFLILLPLDIRNETGFSRQQGFSIRAQVSEGESRAEIFKQPCNFSFKTNKQQLSTLQLYWLNCAKCFGLSCHFMLTFMHILKAVCFFSGTWGRGHLHFWAMTLECSCWCVPFFLQIDRTCWKGQQRN